MDSSKLHDILTVWSTEYNHSCRCFDRFFRHVNQSERKIVPWRRGFLTESVDLIGLNHLWHVVLTADHAIAYKAIELLKDIFTNVSSKLQQEHVSVCVCVLPLTNRFYSCNK